ncbi:MAG: TOBE-like domain-containing protein [Deltaproteobacteria bacterium]|nr:TOBE-like domain-containing protein [Deltaproteobacteria bacterium]
MSVVVVDLEKRYAGPDAAATAAPAVRGVSFAAPTGAITALIGPSGSGKTTLLRLIAGLESADRGRILIADRDVTTSSPQSRGVGLVFQGYALFPHLSVEDNIAFGLQVRKQPRAQVEERVTQMLKLVQLEHLRRRRPAELSGGQRQRIAFARALAIEPAVLLLDEPFGALDARVRAELREWLTHLHDETGTTTLLVTHDQDEALEVSQHVVVLLDGQVAQSGAPQEIYDQPATPATASFLGGRALGSEVHGREGVAFVRPADVRLTRAPVDRVSDGRVGRVERAKIVGPRVKLVLRLVEGGDRIDVDVGRDEYEALGVNAGDVVVVDVRNARVFLNDYAI